MSGVKLNLDVTEFKKTLAARSHFYGDPGSDKIIRSKEIQYQVVIDESHNASVYLDNLIFIDCIFFETVDIGSLKTAGRVIFENCHFKKNVKIATNENVAFDGQTFFEKDVTFSGLRHGKSVITNFELRGTLIIQSDSSVHLELNEINTKSKSRECSIFLSLSKGFLFVYHVFANGLSVTSSAIHTTEYRISNVRANVLTINGGAPEPPIRITNSIIDRFDASSHAGTKPNFFIVACRITEMTLRAQQIKSAHLAESTVASLTILDSLSEGAKIRIQEIELVLLSFNNFFNNGDLYLGRINVSKFGKVIFRRSDLGQAKIISCDFSKAKFEFENSEISELFLSESKFPRRATTDSKYNPQQSQLAFGQLSVAYSIQGDRVNALDQQARELDAYYHSLKKKFPNNFIDLVNLWFNKVSNDFGRNWLLGVIFTFSFGIIAFLLIVESSFEHFLGLQSFSTAALFATFFKFMNPIRFFNTDELFGAAAGKPRLELTGWSYVIDFTARIFIAYGYYQTIQAFRRFGRS
ncbi:MAG TPA: hypothetical protein VKR32_19610 [Puia sp.]|nr:hypothetical protein [Puia sp.]